MVYTTPNIEKEIIPCDWNEGNSLSVNYFKELDIDRYIRTKDYDDMIIKSKSLLMVPDEMNLKLMSGSDICLLTMLQYLANMNYNFRMPINEYAQVEHFAKTFFSEVKKIKHIDLFDNILPGEVIYFSNPGNPSCFYINELEILNIVNNNKEAVFIIDLAYIEFECVFNFNHFINSNNVIFIRTFSKFFGGAGVRLGGVIYSENSILNNFFSVLNSKFVSVFQYKFIDELVQLKFDQQKHSKNVRTKLIEIANKLDRLFDINKLTISGNFIRIDLDCMDTKEKMLNYFKDKKIQVRELQHFDDFKLSIRISYRDEGYEAICF